MALMLTLFCLASIARADDFKRLILIETMPVPSVLEHSKWFQIQLMEMGYKESQNLELTILKAAGDRRLAQRLLVAELEKGMPDLVVTIATLASQVAVKVMKGKDVPILFFQVSDPIGAGLIKKINTPTGTNITGKVFTVSRNAKIEMLMRLVGQTPVEKPIRFGLIHSNYPSALGDIRELKKIEKGRADLVFVPYVIPYSKVPEGLPAMIEATGKAIKLMAGKVDYWVEPMGPLAETAAYTKVLLKNSNIPLILGTKMESVKLGALMHVTPNIETSGREIGILAAKILEGLNPSQVPVTPPSEFDLGFNLTTALRLNIVIPPDMLWLAGENVYR
jgi:putative ABC transport system substrate-binding protein